MSVLALVRAQATFSSSYLLSGLLVLGALVSGCSAETETPGETGTASSVVEVGSPVGAPCATSESCESGLCAPGPRGGICSKPCEDGACDAGWFCESAPWSDTVQEYCLPAHTLGCNACESDSECGGESGRCVNVGGGESAYCASLCQEGLPCASGYQCGQIDGAGDWLCLPEAGRCTCTDEDDGALRQCLMVNEHGTCSGFQLCDGPDGWSDCEAQVPQAETCNGIDDNCNTQIDEGYADTDLDSLKNCIDDDDDGDGVLDEDDNCPLTPNPGQADSGGDPAGDACDQSAYCGDGACNEDPASCPADCGGASEDAVSGDTTGEDTAVLEDAASDVGPSEDVGPDASEDVVVDAPPSEDVTEDAPPSEDVTEDAPPSDDVTEDAPPSDDVTEDAPPSEDVTEDVPPSEDVTEDVPPSEDVTEDVPPSEDVAEDAAEDVEPPIEPVDPVALPYEQDFEEAESLAALDWSTWAAGSDNGIWALSTAGNAGPDAHARFFVDPAAESSTHRLLAPPFIGTGEDFVSVRWAQDVVTGDGASGAVLSVVTSTDGGETWQTAWSYNVGDVAGPEASATADLSAMVGGQDEFWIAFEVTTDAPEAFIYWDIDNVEVLDAVPPILGVLDDVGLTAGDELTVDLTVVDPDSDPLDLDWYIDGQPNFVSLQVNGSGDASIVITPDVDASGSYPDIHIWVSDGVFVDEAWFDINVAEPVLPPIAGLTYLMIRSEAGGAGQSVGSLNLDLGDSVDLFAAGYDQDMSYLGDIAVFWQSTGSLDPVAAAGVAQSAATLNASIPGTSGTVVISHPDPAVSGDSTGTLKVLFPPAGPVSDATSTVHATRSVLLADGVDDAQVVVTLRDSYGSLIGGQHTVELETTAGELVGSVNQLGNGTWTQTLVAGVEAASAQISATVDGSALTDTATVLIIEEGNTFNDGTFQIDCNNGAEYVGSSLIVDGGTLVVDMAGCGPLELEHLLVLSGTVTHSAYDLGQAQAIDISAESIFVAADGAIDVTGKGYPQNTWQGGQSWVVPSKVGGSHGGRGSSGNQPASSSNPVYGNLYDPDTPGAGGGYNSAGGGVVRLEVAGTLTIHGAILAEGPSNANSAGGSVSIRANIITGDGEIGVRGGSVVSNGYGTGSGGRVALLEYSLLGGAFSMEHVGTDDFGVHAYGGSAYGTYGGGAGTVFLHPAGAEHGALVVVNGGNSTSNAPTELPSFGPLPIGEGALTETTLHVPGATWSPDLFAGAVLTPNRDQGELTLTDNTGFLILGNTADTLTIAAGDLTSVAVTGDVAGSLATFSRLVVGGRAELRTSGDLLISSLGGDVQVSNKSAVEARIVEVAAGGSGVTVIDSDLLLEQGGCLVTGDLSVSEDSEIELGWVGAHVTGDIDVSDVSDLSFASGDLFSSGDVSLDDSAVVTMGTGSVLVTGHLGLGGSSVLTCHPYEQAFESQVNVQTASLTVAANAAVDVTGKGYPKGYWWNWQGSSAYTKVGGSHGGWGSSGNQPAYSSNPVYGNLYDPDTAGAGGSYNGAGGGVVRLDVGGTLTVQGVILAEGEQGNSNAAGGSISVRADIITGDGEIRVRGGSVISNGYGTGSGGRVALLDYSLLAGAFSMDHLGTENFGIQARGGAAYGSYGGAAGTVFLRPAGQQLGSLLLSNDNMSTGDNPTELPSFGPVVIEEGSLTATTLHVPGATWSPNLFAGALLTPNRDQGEATLADNAGFMIVSNTSDTLVVSGGDMTSVAQAGDIAGSLSSFAQIWVGGRASLETNGDILLSGDGASLSMSENSEVVAHVVEANGADAEIDVLDSDLILSIGGAMVTGDLLVAGDSEVELGAVGAQVTGDIDVSGSSEMSLSHGDLQAGGNLDVNDTAVVTMGTGTVDVSGDIALTDNSVLTCHDFEEGFETGIRLEGESVTITPYAKIDATGKGYPQGSWWNWQASLAASKVGGSHGGWGSSGNQPGYSSNPVYGNLYDPDTAGAGGGYNGAGGGVVRMDVADTLTVQGVILAEGQQGSSNGAGGSISVRADIITGDGEIGVRGGSIISNGYGTGSGGRVALLDYSLLAGAFSMDKVGTDSFGVHTEGGAAYGSYAGASGTVFLRPAGAELGTLIIANGNKTTGDNPTELPAVPVGVLGDGELQSDSLTVLGATWEPGVWQGVLLTPNREQGEPTLVDNSRFEITANTADTLVIGEGDMSSVAGVGDAYGSIYLFHRLVVRSKAKVMTAADLLIMGDGASVSIVDSVLTAGRLELAEGAVELEVVDSDLNLGLQGVADLDLEGDSSLAGADVLHIEGDLTLSGTTAFHHTAQSMEVGGDLVIESNAELLADGGPILVDGAMHLEGGASVTCSPSVEENECRIVIAAASMEIASGAQIDVSSMGYPQGVWLDWQTSGLANKMGGSHGGRGSRGSVSAQDSTPSYGSLYDPDTLGAGGGYNGPGGGVIRLDIEGTLTVEGQVLADGNQGSSNSAGGSISIRADIITGDGLIGARGGSVVSNGYGTGGGGRVALLDYSLLAGSFSMELVGTDDFGAVAHAGAQYGCYAGAAGTVFVRPAGSLTGTLLADNRGKCSSADAVTDLPSIAPVVIDGGALGATTFHVPGATWVPNLWNGYRLTPNRDEGDPSLGDNTSFVITGSTVDTVTVADGDMTAVADIGDTLGSYFEFADIIVRGRAKLYTTGDVQVSGVDGALSVAGDASVDVHVLETEAGVTLDDSELLASSGGLLVTGDVALVGDSDLALGPLGLNATGDLSLDGTSQVEQGVGAMELGGDVTLEGTSVLTMGSGPMTVTQDVVINSGAMITSAEMEEGFDSQVVITCESMWISEGATIDVTSKGYPQGYWWGWQDAGLGTKVGGSHGGQGSLGNQTNESTNPVYGNLYDPDTPGAGGGYNGRGGGVVRLDVADTLTVQGTILAQGFQGSGNGAGGSVSLRANIITGDGEISVMGGSVISNGYGTGSGGRVALLDYGLLAGAFSLDGLGGDDFGVNVRAGSSYGCYAGSSGTLYLHPAGAVYGSLVVDNGAVCSAATTVTELPAVEPGPILAGGISALAVNVPGETWDADVWTGASFTPNRGQGASTLTDNTSFTVESNTNDTITVEAGDMTTIASVGDTYGMLYRFQNVEVRGKARLFSHADLLVESGDLSSGDDQSFVLPSDSTLEVGVLELTGVTTLDGDPVTELLLCSGCQ